jgi:predicted DsbA family dithiol-disulfide isomerase
MLHLMPKLRVEVWSDVACPWCYIGKRRLEAAVARLPAPSEVEVIWRSFELDRDAPRVKRTKAGYAERLARKYRGTIEQANATIERMTRIAAAEGLAFRLDLVRPGSTFDAHRLLHLARERGVQAQLKERLMRAYFGEGEAIGSRTALVRLAGEAGLEPREVRRVLAGSAYASAVRADEAEARRQAIHAVPFFGIADTYGVAGAQSTDILHGALVQALNELPQRPARGEACGPDGCGAR